MPISPPWASSRVRIASGESLAPTPSSPRMTGEGATPSRERTSSDAEWQAAHEAAAARFSAAMEFQETVVDSPGLRSPTSDDSWQPIWHRNIPVEQAQMALGGTRWRRQLFIIVDLQRISGSRFDLPEALIVTEAAISSGRTSSGSWCQGRLSECRLRGERFVHCLQAFWLPVCPLAAWLVPTPPLHH